MTNLEVAINSSCDISTAKRER